MAEEHERSESEVIDEQGADAVEDLDVPDQHAEDVGGGYSWPWWKKVEE